MHRLFILFSLVALSAACSNAHLEVFPPLSDPELMQQMFSVADMHQDIDYLVTGIRARHPDLAGYADTEALAQAQAAVKQGITQPLTRVQFYRRVGVLSHLFSDGHTFLLWPYPEYQAVREAGHKPFPFAVTSKQGRLYIKHSYSNGENILPMGAQLLAVNNISVELIMKLGQEYMGGETELLRAHVLARRFPQALWSVFGMIDDFTILLMFNGTEQTIQLTKDELWQQTDDKSPAGGEYLSYSLVGDKVGYLRIATFDVDLDEFRLSIDGIFERIRAEDISSLIVDIRDNGGGNTDSVTYLTRYLANRPFLLVSSVTEKLNQDNRGWLNHKGKVGQVKKMAWEKSESPMPESRRFQGNAYLLVGPVSYSAAIVFATTLQDHEFATLIGQATGGYANQSAQGNFFNLPNTELRAYVPTRLLVRPSGDTSVGPVRPDVVTMTSPKELAQGKDTELDAALAIINAQ